jgi:hypothetical protein
MARPPTPRQFYDLEITRLSGMIRAVEVDETRGSDWKEQTLGTLRLARELLAKASPAPTDNRRRVSRSP